ncbi:MAG TPA: hypothetical protein VJT75_16460 [Thermoleophilaceae bacterium]|nr:hypothetical protein [Thermoleophilaceae bacterium]
MGPRSALVLRLAVLAVTIAIGVAVVGLRPAAPHQDGPLRDQLNGKTSQGFPVYGLEHEGRLTGIHLVWRGTCTDGRTLKWVIQNVQEERAHFVRDGRRFSVVDRHPGFVPSGWSARQELAVRGGTSADASSASGTMRGHVSWGGAGHAGGSCDSGPVSWSLRKPG